MHENGRVFGRFFAEIRPTCARILAHPRIGGLPAPGLVGLASIWPVVVRIWRWREEEGDEAATREERVSRVVPGARVAGHRRYSTLRSLSCMVVGLMVAGEEEEKQSHQREGGCSGERGVA